MSSSVKEEETKVRWREGCLELAGNKNVSRWIGTKYKENGHVMEWEQRHEGTERKREE